MGDIRFQCPHCGGNIEVDVEGAGLEVDCPICLRPITIPKSEPPILPAPKKSAAKSKILLWIVVVLLLLGGLVIGLVVLSASVLKKQNLTVQTDITRESFNKIKAQAEKGDAIAENQLGICYMTGGGVARDPIEGFKWFLKAAQQGDSQSQCDVGDCYYFGAGVKTNLVEAVNWYRKAAEEGNTTAQIKLGGCYQNGNGLTKDEVEAVKWYRKAAEQGNATAQHQVGICYEHGDGVAKDEVEAVKWYRKAAEQGDGLGELWLGVCCYYGNGVSKDYVEAHKWESLALKQGFTNAKMVLTDMEKLMTPEQIAAAQEAEADYERFASAKPQAENGDAIAQYVLGASYFHGWGVAQDYAEGIKWYRKAAEQKYVLAEFYLGLSYDSGQGVVKDETEAVKWYRKAAEQGNVKAQEMLGICYREGDGVAKDAAEAVKWYRKAAEQGDAESQNNLGVFYNTGEGVIIDKIEAIKWFRKAADQGEVYSQLMLGAKYEVGDGVVKDFVEADKWFNLASAQGNGDAKRFLSKIEQQMTPNQISEAQRLAREFKPSKEGSGSSTSPENAMASGSGFFITDDGYLISNYHVVKDATKVRLLTGAGLIDAKVVQVDAANDLALLKADGRFAPLPIAASRTGLLGGTVATVGFPDIGLQGFAPKLAKGEIASLSGAGDDPRYFQISVPVQPGNSGGALVDERGNVIGIVSAKLDAGAALAASGALPENVNYAVKSSLLLSFLESVPAVSAKLKAPVTADRKFEDVVKSAQDAAVLVLVY